MKRYCQNCEGEIPVTIFANGQRSTPAHMKRRKYCSAHCKEAARWGRKHKRPFRESPEIQASKVNEALLAWR